MKKKILNQLIAAALVCGSVLAVGATPANAEMKTENGETYYYQESGKKVNGWVLDQGKWYYFNENGEMQKDKTIKDDNGKIYKFDVDGVLILDEEALKKEDLELDKMNISGSKNIVNHNTKITYDSSEAYKKSHSEWQKKGDNWYYYEDDDMKVSTWEKINGIWYYFNDKGIMQKNTTIKDGKGNDCILNADGALTNRSKPEIDISKSIDANKSYGWKQVGNDWYYINSNGDKVAGWVYTNDGKWYYCNKDGVMQKNTTIIEGDKKYVLDTNGVLIR